jgi:transcriptional regulator EpsA
MDNLVTLSKHEEEYLVRTLEGAIQVRRLREFFLWVQGQFQGLLPHEIIVCIQFSEADEVLRIECLRSRVSDDELIKHLSDPVDGLAVRLANYCKVSQMLPCVIERGDRGDNHPLNIFQAELDGVQLGNALVHGTEQFRGGCTFFVLFALPNPPTQRQVFFLDLLLPSLHLAFMRVVTPRVEDVEIAATVIAPVLSERQIEVLIWVTRGKNNFEIAEILELSPLTVKNHMQKIYRKLHVHNRAQAVSRCHVLQLFDTPAPDA